MTAQKRASSSNKKNQRQPQQQQQQKQESHSNKNITTTTTSLSSASTVSTRNPYIKSEAISTTTATTKSTTNKSKIGHNNNDTNTTPRLPNTTICLPIVYGSIAFFLGKKADEYHTHRWTLYIRGPNHEDLSAGISKVVFHLHPSFPQPVRELTSPPFEVTEKGWGEFEATIRIVWKDSNERATTFTHGIKLYPPGLTALQPAGSASNPSTKEPVMSEKYDEVVFTDPTEFFFNELMRYKFLPKISSQEDTVQESFGQFSDDEEFRNLLAAQKFLDGELDKMKDMIMVLDREKIDIDRVLKSHTSSVSSAAIASGGVLTSSKVKGGGHGGKKKVSDHNAVDELSSKKFKT